MKRDPVKQKSLKRDILMRLYRERNSLDIQKSIYLNSPEEEKIVDIEKEIHKLDKEIQYLEKNLK